MSADEVTRFEFGGAIESIRREIQTMGENVGNQLSQILKQLEALTRSTSEDSRRVATLEARVDGIDKRLDSAQVTVRILIGGLATSLIGHLLSFFGGKR